MLSFKSNNEPLERLTYELITLFCKNKDVSDDDITRTIETLNAEHPGNLMWHDAKTIIARLQSLYPSPKFPNWIPERYEFVKPLANGATARVVLAHDRISRKQVAIKLLNPTEPISRIQRETKILRALKSNYIVQLTDAIFKVDDPTTIRAALVMEFVDGQSMNQIINQNKNAPHEINEAVRWMFQSALALKDAHAQGVIHRDIKPANLVVAQKTRAIKLLDFGLASRTGDPSSVTNSGDLLGTPHYLAPEQSRDPTILDPRNDIYSYGATFYHLLTGSTPFQGDYIDLVAQHRNSVPVSPRARNPKLPRLINHVIKKSMETKSQDRFHSFSAILDELAPEMSVELVASNDQPSTNLSSLHRADSQPRRQTQPTPQSSRIHSSLPPVPASNAVREYQGGRTVEIFEGDLIDQAIGTDVIVVWDNNQLSMEGGSAKRVLDVAGPDYFKRTRHLAPALPGRVVVSASGSLTQRFIFHAITIRRPASRATLVTPTPKLIHDLLDSCFYHAESLEIETITIPLLDAGYVGMEPAFSYETILEHLARELNLGRTPVKTVRLVITSRFEF